ncbi:MAG: hypothetical protein KDA86_00675 [Planctomycetaceae bacterium]|nr:hypothetical protein [Planctomycetaceae bacterium]
MKNYVAACMMSSLLTACGCMAQQGVTRGQSPHHQDVNVVPAGHGNLATIQHPIHDAHAYSSSYHSTSGFPGYNGFAGCPTGACGHGGACSHGAACGCGCGHSCPQHYHSYAYSRPHDLRYPSEGAPGGAVVYPYYTHKGPSDFFRK